ncbi:MAG: hypothetical protein O7G83_13860, partial [Proteobacteria bacterium]|nr:hypothetical protein [Pseudomonadota bacterium]
MSKRIVNPRRQRGVIILVVMLIALSASSFVMLKALNANVTHAVSADLDTKQALMEAKQALIGYAVAYADGTHAVDKGPGHLPCPDTAGGNDQGVAESECLLTNDDETGRLPFRTLGVSELTDGSGAALWYAVSNNHRSAATPPLNSDTAGTLSVDGGSDVVAVIIAPGAALEGQSRDMSSAYYASAFLEGNNASLGDSAFVSGGDAPFNDQIAVITRTELMQVIEDSVLNQVAGALNAYFKDPDADDVNGVDSVGCPGDKPNCDDGYPWLRAFDDPEILPFVADPDDFPEGQPRFGHLAFFRTGIGFDAGFEAKWDIDSAGTYTFTDADPDDDDSPPSEDCVRNSECTQEFVVVAPETANHEFDNRVKGTTGGGWGQGQCTLNGPNTVSCTTTYDFSLTAGGNDRDFRRRYTVALKVDDSEIKAPKWNKRREIKIHERNSWSGAASSITVWDYEMDYEEMPPEETLLGSAKLTFDALDNGDDVELKNIPFELEVSADYAVDQAVSPGQLPNWFFTNNWYQLVMVKYAEAESPGDLDATCVADN